MAEEPVPQLRFYEEVSIKLIEDTTLLKESVFMFTEPFIWSAVAKTLNIVNGVEI
jgi:hypothetical protein